LVSGLIPFAKFSTNTTAIANEMAINKPTFHSVFVFILELEVFWIGDAVYKLVNYGIG